MKTDKSRHEARRRHESNVRKGAPCCRGAANSVLLGSPFKMERRKGDLGLLNLA